MARQNTRSHRAKPAVATVTSPLRTTSSKPDTRTFEGGAGHTRDAQTELFLRATGAFHGNEGSFYESADKRDDRLRELTRTVALNDPDWGYAFARWLRTEGNIRTGALMFAVEFVKARLDAQQHGVEGFRVPPPDEGGWPAWEPGSNRRVIDIVCQRPDEPGELLAIWQAWYGRNLPMPVKRGLADAASRLYRDRSLLKYDTDSHAVRFADVEELCHPKPREWWQGDLFEYAIDRRHGRAPEHADLPDSLSVIRHNGWLRERVAAGQTSLLLDPQVLRDAGMTWEDALSLAGQVGADKRQVWEAMIPSMGIMALLRNLRNFDQAGVRDKVAVEVIERLTDPEQIATSRQFPFRFLAAYRATSNSLRWAWPLEQALNHSLVNVPALKGRTLILVDRSPSMFPGYYNAGKSDISRADQAAVFGSALALRAEDATLVEFGGTSRVVTYKPGTSVLKLVDSFGQIAYTNIPNAVKHHYKNHDRVIIITDEQTRPGCLSSVYGWGTRGTGEVTIDSLIPTNVPVFIWNFEGYAAAAMPSGSEARFHLGGLTDKAFRLIPMLESGANGCWPWENSD